MFFRKTTEQLANGVAIPSKTAVNLAGIALVIGVAALVVAVAALVRGR